ncbi:MAG: hypothetical protein CVV10_07885 [Gammaproteobacteria bacterium HGW-Gammaproteobacteria-14]|nr:MAG: hypothetical protein CVV10_07885 [Gammaproteobacteria bacterium HGW-Gammaproteobacteria-14]
MLIFLMVNLTACSSAPKAPVTSEYQAIEAYEDAGIKVYGSYSFSAVPPVQATIKSSGQSVFIRKRNDGELEVKYTKPGGGSTTLKGTHMTLVEGMGLLVWEDSLNGAGGSLSGIIRADGKVDNYFSRSFKASAPQVIFAAEGRGPYSAEAVLVITPHERKSQGTWRLPNYVPRDMWADAVITRNGMIEQTWERLYDFNLTRLSAASGMPLYYRTSAVGHVQFGIEQDEDLATIVTLGPNLEAVARHDNVLIAHVASEIAEGSHINTRSYQFGDQELNLTYEDSNASAQRRALFDKVFLRDHPANPDWFVVLDRQGEEVMPEGAVGMIPIFTQEQPAGNAFNKVLGWVVAYASGDSMRWGWASPAFSYWTGPVWKDWRLEDRPKDHDLNQLSYRRWSIGGATQLVDVRFLSGPYLIAQQDDGQWQLHTMPNYLHPEATF